MTALDALTDRMAELLEAPCTLEDPEFRLIAFSGQGRDGEVDPVRRYSILERRSTPEIKAWFSAHGIRDAVEPLRTPADQELGIAARLCIPARHLGLLQGFFWLLEDKGTVDSERWSEAMEIAQSAASLLSTAEHRQARRDAAYRAAVEGPLAGVQHAANELSAAAGFDPLEPIVCVLVHRPDLHGLLASRPTRNGLIWAREDAAACAAILRASEVPTEQSLNDMMRVLGLRRRLSSLDADTWIGVGPVVTGLAEVAHSRDGARTALRVARSHESGVSVGWDSLGPLALLGVARDADLARALLDPALLDFLRKAPAALRETARVYFDTAGSVGRTASRLSVHRQTVYHRLEQIARLTGCDMDSGNDRLRLHLGLLLSEFLVTNHDSSARRH